VAFCTVQAVLDDVRGYLSDTQVVGGEVFTNAYLLGTQGSGVAGNGSLFGEPYRSMFAKMIGGSKRVQPNVDVVLPAYTSQLIPETVGITDFSEPEYIEERMATTPVAILSTDTGTPITVTTVAAHGLTTQTEGAVTGVTATGSSGSLPCSAPWGRYFITVTGPSTFTLNGSASDGIPGSGGNFYVESTLPFTQVTPTDYAATLDGLPQQCLGSYLWSNNRLQFRGATSATELRITYYSSGNSPTSPNFLIPIDNCRDFLSVATAANAASAKGWNDKAQGLRNRAYGDPSHPEEQSLLDLFWAGQVLASQRGPQRRQAPFRDKIYRFGSYLLGAF
jgi:hypothetical protein